MRLIVFVTVASVTVMPRRLRLRALGLQPLRWALPPCERMTFPVADVFMRFTAHFFVFILGIVASLFFFVVFLAVRAVGFGPIQMEGRILYYFDPFFVKSKFRVFRVSQNPPPVVLAVSTFSHWQHFHSHAQHGRRTTRPRFVVGRWQLLVHQSFITCPLDMTSDMMYDIRYENIGDKSNRARAGLNSCLNPRVYADDTWDDTIVESRSG
jgi:hypothetical protein